MYTGTQTIYRYTSCVYHTGGAMEKKNGYRQIADELRSEIMSGSLEAGKRLLPERELCGRWNVERTTLRRALALL